MGKIKNMIRIAILLWAVSLLSGCVKFSLFSRERNYFVGNTEILERLEELESRLDECDECRERCDCRCDDDDDDDKDDR